MQENKGDEILDLLSIMKDVKSILNPAAKLNDLIPQLEAVIGSAEQKKDAVLLKLISEEVLPGIVEAESLCVQTSNLKEIGQMRDDLQEKENLLKSCLPGGVVHLAADTTANVGDYILVRSFKKLIECKGGPDMNWITADIRQKVSQTFLNTCNQSRCIVLGGGGFFLKDTNPNRISGWQWSCSVQDLKKIEVPIYVLGVGYNRFRGQEEFADCFTESINALVEKSSFFGLRNYGSIRAVQKYLREDLKEKVKYQPCATTVISRLYELPKREAGDPFIALNCAFDRVEMRYGSQQDKVMASIASVCKKLSQSYKIKYYIHCYCDQKLFPYLDNAGVEYEKVSLMREIPEEEYIKLFAEPELVLAVRGHGQMIPFGCRTPVVSMISHDKLKWFLEDIGHPEWGVEVLDEDFEEKLLDMSNYMLANRELICRQIDEAQEKLWNITQENLKNVDLRLS